MGDDPAVDEFCVEVGRFEQRLNRAEGYQLSDGDIATGLLAAGASVEQRTRIGRRVECVLSGRGQRLAHAPRDGLTNVGGRPRPRGLVRLPHILLEHASAGPRAVDDARLELVRGGKPPRTRGHWSGSVGWGG